MEIPFNVEYDTICIYQCIPISYYLIQNESNTFTLIENGVSYKVAIPIGNYNLNSFCNVLSQLLSSVTGKYKYIMT
jgi:hypothetical protein